jgi:glycosyltransferase involved in cell wall biosynthesis
MKTLRILHIENQAGVPYSISEGQKQLGHDSKVLETYRGFVNEPHDFELYYGGNLEILKNLRNLSNVIKLAKGYDLIHLHGGVHWKRVDALAIRKILRKPMVVHYHGSETRQGYGLHYRNLWKVKLVSRPDLLEWLPEARFIRSPIAGILRKELPEYPLKVLHMYHNPKTKGSGAIIRVLESLKKEGLDFEYEIIIKKPHEEALKAIARSHIVIDQFLDREKDRIPSVIGMISLESMAMGRAVISTMDTKYRQYYPECPVVYCEPNEADLAEGIRRIADEPGVLRHLVESGVKYVNEYHSPLKTAKELDSIYSQILPPR